MAEEVPEWLSVGMAVEVMGEENGYSGSFSTARIVAIGEKDATVEYDEFLTDDESAKLQETFTLENIFRVRPALPACSRIATFRQCKAGHTVDLYDEDCWWQGIVQQVLATRLKIMLSCTERDKEVVTVINPDAVRLGHVWVPSDLRWYRRRVTLNLLRQVGVTGHTAHKAVEDMMAAPMLFIDGSTVPADLGRVVATRSRRNPGANEGARAGPKPSRAGSARRNWEGSSGESEDNGDEGSEDSDDERDGGGGSARDGGEDADADAAAAAAAAEAAALDEWGGLGRARPKRENKTRVVYVNGHPVLRENMYDLETGEPSVFSKELNKENNNNAVLSMPGVSLAPPARAMGKGPDYLYHGAKRAPGQHWSQVREAQERARGIQTGLGDGGDPFGRGGGGPARTDHNERVRQDREASEAHRAIYLKHHLDKIKPFITPQVHKSLLEKAAAASERIAQELPPEPVQEQPPQITGQLREYQMLGLQWLVRCFDHGINAILADEMGLGKTLQTISFLAYLKFVRKVEGPHLVVVPLSVLPNWMAEFRKWCPEMRVVRLHVNDEGERKRLRKDVLSNPSSFDIAVTTYDMVHSQHFGDAIRNLVVWRYLVLDEGHKVKNEETLISQTMRRISRQHVLMLTGTPVQNNLRELYALLNFMYGDVFTDPAPFDSGFNLVRNAVDDERLAQAHYLLRPFMLRRVKDEVECKLPPRLETRINCPLSEMQTFWYRRLLLKESSLLAEMEGVAVNPKRRGRKPRNFVENGEGMPVLPGSASVQSLQGLAGKAEPSPSPAPEGLTTDADDDAAGEGDGGGGGGDDDDGGNGGADDKDKQEGGANKSYQRFMNLLMQLRKCCNHPFMFPDSEPDYDGSSTGEEIVEGSGKMKVLDQLLIKLKQRGHRVVLFSQFNIMLDVIEDYLIMRGYKYRRLDGSTNRIQRMIDIEMFNKPKSDVFIYILCTRAGGLGVNLQTADTCILYDSDWNPQWDLQAMARVHRIGQTRPVHVYRLCSEGTVEDRIQRRAEQKLYLDQMVNRGSTAAAEEMEALDKKELLSMLKFGADRIFKNDSGRMPTHEELDALLDRSQMMAEEALREEERKKKREDKERAAAAAAAGAGEAAVTVTAEAEAEAGPGPDKMEVDAAPPGAGPEGGAKLEPAAHPEANGGGASAAEAGPGSAAAAEPAAEAEPAAGPDGLQAAKHSALEFNAQEQPLSTFMLDGIDYKKLRELQQKGLRDIARDWVTTKRERKSTTTQVDVKGVGKVAVLNENNYSMQQGGISVNAPKAGAHGRKGQQQGPQAHEPAKRSRLQIAGRDYGHMDFCQVCWDGGNLLCCDYCPASMHPQCIGMTMRDAASVKKWACPQHSCATCGRNTAAAGGLLFRCEACPYAFCEDCLPEEHDMVGECDHFKALGQVHPKQACFILCSAACKKQRESVAPMLDKLIEDAVKLGHQKAVEAAIVQERDAAEAARIEEEEQAAYAAELKAQEKAAAAAAKAEAAKEKAAAAAAAKAEAAAGSGEDGASGGGGGTPLVVAGTEGDEEIARQLAMAEMDGRRRTRRPSERQIEQEKNAAAAAAASTKKQPPSSSAKKAPKQRLQNKPLVGEKRAAAEDGPPGEGEREGEGEGSDEAASAKRARGSEPPEGTTPPPPGSEAAAPATEA